MNRFKDIIEEESQKDYYKKLHEFIYKAYEESTVFPDKKNIFAALKYTPYENVKVVILGQDPYHGVGEANGLCFSVNRGVKMPPSLRNIYKELYDDLEIEREDTDLSDWAMSGVLLLNSVLTVEKDKAASHKFVGWEEFTDSVIKKLSEREEPIVFILWGNFAKSKMKYITNPNHLILSSAHPSPLSAHNGFFGSKPFSKTNEFLKKNGMEEIKW